ncbi:DUF488 domain-containing protein [Flavobacterium aquicola]|uniref:Uncharacterized protein DUF488 n=1 Tax=Flavobacterium aquicola TaxID=1682742 RepID=A0A3E0EN55_9FLAO|nr:DUF488 domain-containing protein [Flavobacterium aquicola]REG99143.1 uncharacterized protein DUF488 [Flavobacterium aquicola]
MAISIYTIGYGNRQISNFIQLLQKFEIEILIDVRTNPFSRFNPEFRTKKLELHLINHEIKYLFLGTELGGKPSDLSCYTNGEVDYSKIQFKDFFIEGIEQVVNLNLDGLKIALMCAEQSPLQCHRKALIGDYLKDKGFEILHIDKDGSLLNELF